MWLNSNHKTSGKMASRASNLCVAYTVKFLRNMHFWIIFLNISLLACAIQWFLRATISDTFLLHSASCFSVKYYSNTQK